MIDLKNKNILLFIPQGKGIYGTGVFEELESRGAFVKIYDERPSKNAISKFILRFGKKIVPFYFNTYIKKVISENSLIGFDFILVVRGEVFNQQSIRLLERAFPQAKRILYLWDSLRNTDTRVIFPFFDKVFSFDKIDVEENLGLIHRPQFYLNNYRDISDIKPRDIDVLFIGTAHHDRYRICKIIESQIKDLGGNSHLFYFFPSKLVYFFKKIVDSSYKKAGLSEFNFHMLKADQVAKLLAKSKASLDIQDPKQTGITMRTIEVLGAKRKLITTNEAIRGFDFYDKNNILILDRKNPFVDINFINSPFKEINSDIYEKYSIEKWVDDVFAK